MYFTPKKTIPQVAAAGLALAGCGDEYQLRSDLQRAMDRMERMDPLVTAFCMKNAECYPYWPEDVDYCRRYYLSYADTLIQLSDDPAACYRAGASYFECFEQAACETAESECYDEWAALEIACSYGEE